MRIWLLILLVAPFAQAHWLWEQTPDVEHVWCQTAIDGTLWCDDKPAQNTFYRFHDDGMSDGVLLDALWTNTPAPDCRIESTPVLKEAIRASLRVARGKVKRTLKQLQQLSQKPHFNARNVGDTQALQGFDKRGNVQFTGYFTPLIDASDKPDEHFQSAIYRQPPECKKVPTCYARRKIDEQGVLAGRGLESAYIAEPLDIFVMQVQGSALLRFPDGRTRVLAFDGRNNHPYVSIGKLLVQNGKVDARKISLQAIRDYFAQHPDELNDYMWQNPSYTFMRLRGEKPQGSSGAQVLAGYSVAVDPRVIAYGTPLLAQVPIVDDKGKLERHECRLLFAHDKGSAINGPGHIDLYTGVGDEAGAQAGRLHHYGRVWRYQADASK